MDVVQGRPKGEAAPAPKIVDGNFEGRKQSRTFVVSAANGRVRFSSDGKVFEHRKFVPTGTQLFVEVEEVA